MSEIFSTIDPADIRWLQIIIFSLAGAVAGGCFSSFPAIDRLGALTLIFLLQLLLGFSPDNFTIFATAAFVAVILNRRQDEAIWPGLPVSQKWLLGLLAPAMLLAVLFWQQIAEFIIQAKSVGMIYLLVAVLLGNLIIQHTAFGKSLVALSLGLLLAYFGPSLSTGSFNLPFDFSGGAGGIDILIVLTGISLFAPMLTKQSANIANALPAKTESPLFDIVNIAVVLVFGFGATVTSIVMFAMLHYESVAFGALASLDNLVKPSSALIAIPLAAAAFFSIKDSCRELCAKPPAWIVQTLVSITAIAIIIISGAGIVALYAVLLIAFIGKKLTENGLPAPLFLIGFIYGSQLQYLINIAALTEQNFLTLPTLVIVILTTTLTALFRRYSLRPKNQK